jgi:hypothetical protein
MRPGDFTMMSDSLVFMVIGVIWFVISRKTETRFHW